MRADLHVHSTASDGTLSPTALVERAARLGVEVLALADHDSVAGITEAMNAAQRLGIALIPAVELSAVWNGRDVHVLAYHVDPASTALQERLEALRDARMARALSMVDALAADGYDISIDDVQEISAGGSVGRSHVGRALVASGDAQSVRDAFERFIGHGRPYYVAKASASPFEVIAQVQALGAISVVAHPYVTGVVDLIPQLVEAGMGGIEAYHADHTAEQRQALAALATQLGVLCTGGSDFHGPDAPNPEIGSVELPEGCVTALLAASSR